MNYRNVSKSFYSQIKELKGTVNANSLISADTNNTNIPTSTCSNRSLLLTLTDSVNEIEAFEYEPWKNIIINNISIGCKCRLRGPFIIRNKLAFLKKENIELLGGEVEELSKKTQLSIVEELLKHNTRKRTSTDRHVKKDLKTPKLEPVSKTNRPVKPIVVSESQFVNYNSTIQDHFKAETNLNQGSIRANNYKSDDVSQSNQKQFTTNQYSTNTVPTNNNRFDDQEDNDLDDCFSDISFDEDIDWPLDEKDHSIPKLNEFLPESNVRTEIQASSTSGMMLESSHKIEPVINRVLLNQVTNQMNNSDYLSSVNVGMFKGDELKSRTEVTSNITETNIKITENTIVNTVQVKQPDTILTNTSLSSTSQVCTTIIQVFQELSQPEANNITVKTFRVKAVIQKFVTKLRIDTSTGANGENDTAFWHLELCLGDGTASVNCLLSDGFICSQIGYSAQVVQNMKASKSLTDSCRQAVKQFQDDIVKKNCGIFLLQVHEGSDKLQIIGFQPIDAKEAAAVQSEVQKLFHSG